MGKRVAAGRVKGGQKPRILNLAPRPAPHVKESERFRICLSSQFNSETIWTAPGAHRMSRGGGAKPKKF
jgi:hypothetical protein